MISFSDWFANLLVQFPMLRKRFRESTINGFLGTALPTHEQSIKICEVVGDSPKVVKMYKEQLEKILRYQQTPRGITTEHVIMFHPKAAPRPRFTRYGKPYNPKEYTDWKKDLAEILGELDPQENCQLDIEFHFVSKKAVWGPHTIKPDGDNLLKAFQDALQLAGFVSDDCRLWDVRVRKYYSFSSKIICRITR
jgi:Holliday junction resolvase RusA-like endonuclease